jgi:hypothetical protein
MDAALAGVIDVTGRRVLGIDRRRVILGPQTSDDPLLADVRRRVEVASSDSPDGWIDRVNVFGEDAVAEELVAAGLASGRELPFYKRILRHRTLDVDPAAAAEARARLEAGNALGLILRETELLNELVGRKAARRIGKRVDEATLPPLGRAIVATLRERRRRADAVGTYAD